MALKCVCPECKNEIKMSAYPSAKKGDVIECETCGMTLEITDISGVGEVGTEIVDEGK